MTRARALAAGLAGIATLALAADDPFGFMPDGGRGLLARVFPDPAAQSEALATARSAEDWEAAIAAAAPDLEARPKATLAAYLSAAAPLAEGATDLPQDGRDLALNQCQSCHSLFTGYLMQRRDRAGWLAIFKSPFHSTIPMTPEEQAVFADYSAINMPMRFEDVPPELRF